jgi:hypothetical protein
VAARVVTEAVFRENLPVVAQRQNLRLPCWKAQHTQLPLAAAVQLHLMVQILFFQPLLLLVVVREVLLLRGKLETAVQVAVVAIRLVQVDKAPEQEQPDKVLAAALTPAVKVRQVVAAAQVWQVPAHKAVMVLLHP